jgi:SpoVK/Ycf46/Vps4 family AAA+-type ATPase
MPLHADVSLPALAGRTHGFSGAELAALTREAALAALEEDLDTCQVCARHFDKALCVARTSAPFRRRGMALFC